MMPAADDIMLVRASFARVALIRDAVADLFYGRLFEVAPQPLFPADLRAQKRKLMGRVLAATMQAGAADLPDTRAAE
jgi:hypothetical protein